jgi:hypothetical protein
MSSFYNFIIIVIIPRFPLFTSNSIYIFRCLSISLVEIFIPSQLICDYNSLSMLKIPGRKKCAVRVMPD